MTSKQIPAKKQLYFAQTWLIALVMVGVVALLGYTIFGWIGLAVAGGIVLAVVLGSRQRRDLQALPVQLEELSRNDAPAVYRIVEDLTQKAGLASTPSIYLLPMRMMNAATMGSRADPKLIVTPSLLERLDERELRCVLAHEMSHVRHNDLLFFKALGTVSVITIVISRAALFMLILYFPLLLASGTGFSPLILVSLFAAPVLSVLLQLAAARAREFSADLGAVELTEDPETLASALTHIDNVQQSMWKQLVPGRRNPKNQPSVFRAHPPTDERAEKLRAIRTA
jgi:heat shock protein HtpX